MLLTKRIMVAIYLNPAQKLALNKLSDSTGVPVAAYVRKAIDDLLKKRKYSAILRSDRKKTIRIRRRPWRLKR